MPTTAVSLAQLYGPVPQAPVALPVGPPPEQSRSPAPAVAKLTPVSLVDGLRQARADALAELQNAPDVEDSNARRYLGLDRDQLAAMVFDRKQVYSIGERRSAQRQLETNDRAYLDRASELATISGDERVVLNARLEIELSKSAIERAVPRSDAVDTAALQAKIAEKTAQLGGSPASISLRYPNGWAASGNDVPSSDRLGAGHVLPGAARLALLYRESLF